MRAAICLFFLVLIAVGTIWAQATPPEVMNYQGVLRDASGAPLDGDFDMVFHFYDAETSGNLIMSDSHTSTDPPPVGPVTVTGGLFNVHLGDGVIIPGPEIPPDVTLSGLLAYVSDVWLEIEVGTETLTPRVRLVSAGYALYALNALRLGDREPSQFLDTSDTAQTKYGTLSLDAPTTGIEASGNLSGGTFQDTDESGIAHVGTGDLGIQALGNEAGGWFRDADNSGYAYVGYGDLGIAAAGPMAGGHFWDTTGSGQAWSGYGDIGIQAMGNQAGGYFNSVGIGTSTPSSPLEVVGNAKISGLVESTTGGFKFPDGSVQTSALNSARPDPPCFDQENRFADCGNGTVTDQVTGLIWLKDAACLSGVAYATANIRAASLGDGTHPECNLTDGSSPGDWRLRTKDEWQAIFDQADSNGCGLPALPDVVGTGCCATGTCPFSGVYESGAYWSSTTNADNPSLAWWAWMGPGFVDVDDKFWNYFVWPVRGGQ